jgi:sensor histidine kinase YesM
LVQAAARAFALAFWTPPIFFIAEKCIRFSSNRVRYVLLWGLGAIPFVFLHITIAWLVIPPYVSRSVQTWVEDVRSSFADDTFAYVAIVVAAHAYVYLKRVRRQEAERSEYQRALAASELQALKMQLQPHFLFNTLHGIATLTHMDAENARAMIVKLSNLLRTALSRGNADLIPLEEEFKFVRDYLELEKMRLGTRLTIKWVVAPQTSQLLVPQMILLPLVENAIRHGVASSREPGWVELASSADNGVFHVIVRNSPGNRPSKGTGVGLHNVEARLRYLYSGNASLSLSFAEDRIATARLTLPALKSQPDRLQGHQLESAFGGRSGYASPHRR